MQLPRPLHSGTLLRRYKRFLADVLLDDGTQITAHCPNPGRMTGLDTPGFPVWLSYTSRAGRKHPHTLELLEAEGQLVGINTSRPNGIVAEALEARRIDALAGYAGMRREVRYGTRSRIDLLLEDPERVCCWVEVKNVHLRRDQGPNPGAAEFPDAVTARGARHLHDLADRVREGERAVMVYVVQRMDCDRFCVAADIDPDYAEALAAATTAGVEAICYDCTVTTEAVTLRSPLPVDLG